MNRKKVLHILWTGGIGGAEEFVTSIVKYFDYSRYDIHLCFLSKKGAIYEEALKINNVKVDFIGIDNRFDILGAVKFVRYLYKEKFDIVHSHIRGSYLFAGLLAFYRGPKVLTHHLSPGDTSLHKDAKIFYRMYSGLFQKVTVISNAAKKNLIDDLGIKHPDRIEVVYNGVDLNKFSIPSRTPEDLQDIKSAGKFVIGFVGRMYYFKRPDLFIDIAAKLLSVSKDFVFVMVGDGPEFGKSKKMIADYNISENFRILGFRRDIPSIMNLFDALLFTSQGEGFGIVVVEAMANGTPVFAINDGAVPEIISHRENGILFDTLNPEEIARQILDVIRDRKLLDRMKEQCVRDVQSRFSIEASVRKMEKIYEDILTD